jgi:hypothetical protein
MSWRIGKCERCGEPKGDWYACVFRMRKLWGWWRVRAVRVWVWYCDDCADFERQRRDRRRQARLARKRLDACRSVA